jgi:hypothetical protein
MRRPNWPVVIAALCLGVSVGISLAQVGEARASLVSKPLYAWGVVWYVTPVHLRDTIRVDSLHRGVVGDSAQACRFATDTQAVNGHRYSRRVLLNGANPVCAVAFRMWDSVETAKYAGPWP